MMRIGAGVYKSPTLSFGGQSTITPVINASTLSGSVPLAVHFHPIGTTSSSTSRPFQDLLYRWTFGDPGSGNWLYGVAGRSKNTAWSAISAHVYDTPGTYAVTLQVYDGAGWASATTTITATSADTAYSGTNTICVSNVALPVAGVDGVPAGAQCNYIASGLYNDAAALVTSSNKRLMLKYGETWTRNGAGVGNGAYTGVNVTKYGSGANPVINMSVAVAQTSMIGTWGTGFKVYNIDFTSTTNINPYYQQTLIQSDVSNTLVYHCNASGGVSSLCLYRYLGVTQSSYNHVIECTINDPQGGSGSNGTWGNNLLDSAVMGNSINRCSGIEHNIRFQGGSRCVISNNTCTDAKNTKHLIALRGYTSNLVGTYVDNCVVSDNYLYDTITKSFAMQIAPQDTASNEPMRNILVERNQIIMDTVAATYAMFVQCCSGVVIRNNLIRNTNFTGIEIAGVAAPVAYPTTDIQVYNNSVTSMPGSGSSVGYLVADTTTSQATRATGIVFKNNICYTSGANGVAIGTQGDRVALGITYTESNNSTTTQFRTVNPFVVADPTTNPANWDITGGSYAKGTGVPVPVWEDFDGDVIAASRPMGAKI